MIKQVTIGSVTYNAAMASAVKQDELLSLLSADIIGRCLQAAKAGAEVDDMVLVPMMMTLPQTVKQQVAAVLMHQVVIAGTSQTVTVNDFGGKMVDYNKLLAELLRFNLSDFFDWLSVAAEDVRAAARKAQAR